MADAFDPYYTWLGIRPEEQPPDHYRLVGLRQFEDNADVIANATDQKMQFLRSMQVGKRSAQSQMLLNEVSAAGGCLLDPQRKAKYDQELRAKDAAQAQAAKAAFAKARPLPKAVSLTPIPKPAANPVIEPLSPNDIFAQVPAGPAKPSYATAPASSAAKVAPAIDLKSPIVLAAAGGGALVLVALMAIAGWMLTRGDKKIAGNTLPAKPPAATSPTSVPATTPSTATIPTLKPGEIEKTPEANPPVELPEEFRPAEPTTPPKETVPSKTDEPARSDWKPPSQDSTATFRSFLGTYMYWLDRRKMYPVVNLHVPNKNLWTEEIQQRVQGKISFDEISYAGTAKIAIPAEGVYLLGTDRAAKVLIDELTIKDIGEDKGEVRISQGVHDVTLEVHSHGQPHMRECSISLKHKETGEEVAFFNTWQDIQQFLGTPIADQRVIDVSDWQPTPENELKIDERLLASAGVTRPSVPAVVAGPPLPTPVHSWTFDEKSGDTVADSGKGDSRGKSPLRLDRWGPAQPRFVPGRIGNALRFYQQEQFAATQRYVDFPQLTIAFWLKVLGEQGINPRIAHPWVELNYEKRAGVGALGMVFDPDRPQVATWHHYAVAINQETKQAAIFRDGNPVADGKLGDYESRRNVKYWAFGHNQDQSNPSDSLHGELDELKIYDQVLTPAEVKQLAAVELAKATGKSVPVASIPSTTSPAPALKATVPDTAALAAAQQKVAAVFGAELKGKMAPPAKQKLAKTMLEAAATTTDPAQQYALYWEARRLALEAKDVALALLVLDGLGADFKIDPQAEKVLLLQGLAAGNPTPAQRSEALEAVCEAGHEALAADNLEAVTALVTLARSLAAKNATPEGKAEAKEFIDLAAQRQKRIEALRKAEQTLAMSPENAAANLVVGLHTFFIRGMEKEGIAMLARGSDAKLAAAAQAREGNMVKGQATSIEEADAWFDAIATVAGDYKLDVQRKALEGYTLFAASGNGLGKIKAEKRRQELVAALPAGADQPAKRLRPADVPEKSPGMIGRVLVDGKDSGILITHLPRGEMATDKLRDVLAQAKVRQIRLVLVGTITSPTPCTLRLFHSTRDSGPPQVVLVDGKQASIAGGSAESTDNASFPLAAGDHLVQWVCDFDGTTRPRLDLYFERGGEGQFVLPHCPRAQEYAARKVRFHTEIDLSPNGRDAR
ncbi:MAG: LamG-like jellyroll fold domain-containing protein [Pirellulaceae bacterium]